MPDKELLEAKQLTYYSEKQKALFEAITQCGTLTFVTGPRGIGAHLVGPFCMREYDNYGPENRLDYADGSCHIHIDWSRVSRCEFTTWEGEGESAFYDGDELLFKIFRLDGFFPPEITAFSGSLF